MIYRGKIRTQRTRAFPLDIPERENQAEILFTLLGIELKVGRKRIACPDLATARYLRVFAWAGCRAVAVPYDITRISVVADELEVAWHKMIMLNEQASLGLTPQAAGRSRSALIRCIRKEIDEAGAGPEMPVFKTNATGGIRKT